MLSDNNKAQYVVTVPGDRYQELVANEDKMFILMDLAMDIISRKTRLNYSSSELVSDSDNDIATLLRVACPTDYLAKLDELQKKEGKNYG